MRKLKTWHLIALVILALILYWMFKPKAKPTTTQTGTTQIGAGAYTMPTGTRIPPQTANVRTEPVINTPVAPATVEPQLADESASGEFLYAKARS